MHPYLLRLQVELVSLSSMPYFQPVAAVLVFVLFFLIGRKSYQSKYMHVLNTINDRQNEKKRLSQILQQKKKSSRNLENKMTYFKLASLVIVLAVVVYLYIKKFNPIIVIITTASLLIFWIIIILYSKYLTITINKTQELHQQKLLSSEADAKQIMGLLGQDICKQLKSKFERELQVQWRTEELKDCDLRKCQEEKSIYKDLYQLYKDIIGEMQKMQWCDTCSQMLNTDANQIKLFEFQSRLKNYKNMSDRLNLQKKKELTNRLLEEWQFLQGKLPFMCKRGCCIRFRVALEGIKKDHHERLKNLKSRLNMLK